MLIYRKGTLNFFLKLVLSLGQLAIALLLNAQPAAPITLAGMKYLLLV